MTTWADLAALFSSPLSPDDIAGGWTDSLRSRWQQQAVAFRDIGMRFLPSDAAPLLKAFRGEGVTSGPIVEAMTAAKNGFGGVGTTRAVALAVKLLVVQTPSMNSCEVKCVAIWMLRRRCWAERPGDPRRQTAVRVLTKSDPAPDTDERALRDWLLARLKTPDG